MANYNTSLSTEEYLTQALETAKTRLLRETQNPRHVQEERENAKLLQDFLNLIANTTQDDNNLISGIGKEILMEKISMLGMDKAKNVKLFTKSKGLDKSMTGVKFETWLEDLINKVMINAEKNDYVSYSKDPIYKDGLNRATKNLGSKQIDLLKGFDNLVDETTKRAMTIAYKTASEKFNQDYTASTEDMSKYHLKAQVDGKIDVANRYVNFTVKVDEDPLLNKILTLLSESSFSNKAYANKGSVELGKTNSFRAFTAMTNNGSAEEVVYRWHRMRTCMDAHEQFHNAPFLFYQLKYIYELTGYGQVYNNDKVTDLLGTNGVRFLIYYPLGEPITVVSTAAIVEDFLNNMTKGNQKFDNITKESVLGETPLYLNYSSQTRQFAFGN